MKALPLLFLLTAALVLAGCGQVITLSTPTPTATSPVEVPTVTPRPTATPVPSTPAPTLTPTPTPTPVIYVVGPGDTLIAIARKYGVTVEALQEANAILDPRLLQIGQELVIPQGEEALVGPPTPTPTPLPLRIEGIGFYETPAGGLWCLGEVRNTAGVDIERVEVQVSLYDENDRVLAANSAFTMLDVVPRGGKAPFAILFAEPPEGFASYRALALSAEPATYLGSRYLDLAVVEHRGKAEGDIFYVMGQVRNTGQADAKEVTVVVTAYDAQGRVVGVRAGAIEADVLPAGETSPFQVNLFPIGGVVADYAVQVQGKRNLP